VTPPDDRPLPEAFVRLRGALTAALGKPGLFPFLLLAIAVAGLTPHFLDVPGPDTAWLLYAARQTLHGARYAIDVAEINPPLIVWIKVPAVAVAEATGIGPVVIWWGFGLLLIGASLALAARFSRPLAAGRLAPERRLLLLGLAAALLILPEREFGQKEHLSIICALPLLLLAGVRSEGAAVSRGSALAAGILGGIGIAFKPHFALVGLAVEVLVQLRARRPRPGLFRLENMAVLAVGLVYLGSVTLFAPAYWGFARTWAGLYHQFLHVDPLLSLVFGPPLFLLFAIPAALGLRRIAPAHTRPVEVLVVACLGYYVAAVAQHKGGLGYRFLPAVVTAYCALWWLLLHAEAIPPSVIRRLYLGLATAAVVLLPFVSIGRVIRRGPLEADPLYSGLPEAVAWTRSHAAEGGVLVLSTHIGTAFPLVYLAEARLASRHPHLWQLAALYDHELWESDSPTVVRRPRGRGPLEQVFIDQVVEDFVRHRPALIVVPPVHEEWWGAAGSRWFDYLSYFRSDPRFDREFAEFQFDRAIGEYVFYTRVSGSNRLSAVGREVAR
jgi:hypothetical protein